MSYYWRQKDYNLYVLVPPDGKEPIAFESYAALCAYCSRRGINAKQA